MERPTVSQTFGLGYCSARLHERQKFKMLIQENANTFSWGAAKGRERSLLPLPRQELVCGLTQRCPNTEKLVSLVI